jgi:hypothetical protein
MPENQKGDPRLGRPLTDAEYTSVMAALAERHAALREERRRRAWLATLSD